jgi:hypothetical protein
MVPCGTLRGRGEHLAEVREAGIDVEHHLIHHRRGHLKMWLELRRKKEAEGADEEDWTGTSDAAPNDVYSDAEEDEPEEENKESPLLRSPERFNANIN